MDDRYSDFFIDDFGTLDLENTDEDQLADTESSCFCQNERFVVSKKELVQLIRMTVRETLEQMDIY
ncbi:hypothetical protein HNQ56_000171 [Anaerotaenia torta]|uniref:hypothetical protein n=1 Tax=Anaerotaenia torta TaxID=433293 RepID=UPI003D1E71DE